MSADKNHHIVAACKVLQTLHAVGDIAANGIVVFEDRFLTSLPHRLSGVPDDTCVVGCSLAFCLSPLYLRHNLLKLLDGLGGLGDETQ